MAIVDTFNVPQAAPSGKDMVVHTEHGDFYISRNHHLNQHCGVDDFVLITDLDDNRTFMVNKFSIVWIGPR